MGASPASVAKANATYAAAARSFVAAMQLLKPAKDAPPEQHPLNPEEEEEMAQGQDTHSAEGQQKRWDIGPLLGTKPPLATC